MLDKDGIKKTTTISALIMFLIASASCNYFKGYPVFVWIFFPQENHHYALKMIFTLLAKIAQSDGN